MSKDIKLQQITQELKQIWGEKLLFQNDKLLHFLLKRLIDTDGLDESVLQNLNQDLNQANNKLQNCFRTAIFERNSEILKGIPEDKFGKTAINKKKSQDLINETFQNDIQNCKNQPQLQEELYHFLLDNNFAAQRIQRIINQSNKPMQQVQGTGQSAEQWQQQQLQQQQQQQQQQYGYYQSNPQIYRQQQQQMPYQQDQSYFNQNLADPSDPSLNQQQYSSYQGNGANPYSFSNHYSNADPLQETSFQRADSNYNDGMFGNNIEDTSGVDASKNNVSYRQDNYIDTYDTFNEPVGGSNDFGGQGNSLLNGTSKQTEYFSNLDQQYLPADQFFGAGDNYRADDYGEMYDYASGVDGQYPSDPYAQPPSQQPNQQIQQQISQPLQQQNQRYIAQQNKNFPTNQTPATSYPPSAVPTNTPQIPPTLPQAAQHDNFNQNNSLQSSGVYGPQNNSRQANLPGALVNDPQNQFYQQQAIQQQQIPQPHNDFSQQQQPGYKQNQVIGSSQNVDQQAYYQQQQQFRNIGPLNNSMHSVNPQQIPLQKPPQIQQNMPAQPQNSNQQRPTVQQQPQQMGGLSSSQQQQNPSLHSSLVGNRVQQPPQQQNPQQIQQQQPQPNTVQLPNQELDTPQPQSDYNQAAVPLNGSVHNPINYQPIPNAQHQPIPNQFNNQQQGMNGLQAYQSLNESNHSQGKGSNSNHGSQHRSSNNKQLQVGQQAVGSPYNPQNMPYQQNPGQPNQSLTSSQYANQQNGRYPPAVYPNQAGPVQGNSNMQQPTFKSTTNLNSSIERINQRAQEDGLKNSYHKANPQYNNPQNFQQGLPAQKSGIPNNPQSSNDLRSSYQHMNQINQTGGQIQPPAVVQQPSNQIKIDNAKGQNIINPQIPSKGIVVKPDGNVPPQFNQVGIHQQPPINYQPGQPIPQSVEQQIPHQTIPTSQPGSKANQAKLGLQQQQQQQQQQMLHNGTYNQANQPPGQQQPPQPVVQANSKRMNQPMQGPNQIDPQIQQQQFNQGQFNNVQIPPMPQGNAIPVAVAAPSAPVQGPPGALVAGPGGQGYINNGKPSQNSKYLGNQPQGLPQQQQLQGNQQQLQQQQVGLQQQNMNQQQLIKQNIQQHQQVQPSQQQQHQQHLQIAGQSYSSNLMHNTQGKPYNVGAKNGGKQSILLEDIPSFLNNPYQIDEDNKGYDLLQITKSENNSPRNSNMNESSSTMNEQHNQFFPTSKNQPLNTSVTQTPTIEYPQNGPNHHAPHQGYPPHLIQKNPNFPVDPNNPQVVQSQQQQPTYMQKGQYPNNYQQQYPYQAMDPNTQHQMMQQGPYSHVPVQSNQVPVNRQMSQNKLNDDQMQPIQMNQQQNPQLQQQWMGQQRGNNMQLQNQNVQMMNPNYFNPQQQQPVQNMMKNGYHQQSSTNNIDNSDMNNSSYFNQQQVDQSKIEDSTQRPNDNISQTNLDQSPYNLGNSNLQVKKGMNMGPGRQMGMDQIQNQMNVFDNNANPEMMQDGNGEIRNRQNNNSQELKKDQGQAANSAQVVKWTPNQQGLNQDEDLCLIKEVFSKSNSYDPEMQRQITSEVQKFKQNNQNLTIKAIRSQDEPSFKLEIKDKKRKDFKELVLMVCPRKDSPYEITDCKNLWSLNKQRIPKTNSLMDIIKFWWKFEFQTIEDEKKQNSNNNSGGMHNQNQLMPMNGMNNMQQQIQNNLNPY